MNVVIRNNFKEYFGNPIMKKVKRTHEGAGVYIAQVRSLSFEKKYVVAIARDDGYPVGHTLDFHSIRWHVLQTKILNTDYNVFQFHYEPNRNLLFFKEKARRINSETFYSDKYNLTIGIKKVLFKEEISLTMAIEQYDTTIMLGEENE